jgi:RNA polymerase sigma factor (sigma-70 family)
MHGLPSPDLVRQYAWIAEKFASRYRASAPGADLEAAGMLGLVEAAARFEPERGLRFSTYAWTWVKGAVLAELRRSHVVPVAEWTARQDKRQGKAPRVSVVFGALDEDTLPGAEDDADAPDATSDRQMRLRGVREAAERLEDPIHRYVVGRTLDGLAAEQIAAHLGVCDERIRQHLRQAQTLLAEELWDPTWEDDHMDDDTQLTESDIRRIQDPDFYKTEKPFVRRLAVAVLEARAREQQTEDPQIAALQVKLDEEHERFWKAEKAIGEANQKIRDQRELIVTLEAALEFERARNKTLRETAFANLHAKEVRALLRQAARMLTP